MTGSRTSRHRGGTRGAFVSAIYWLGVTLVVVSLTSAVVLVFCQAWRQWRR